MNVIHVVFISIVYLFVFNDAFDIQSIHLTLDDSKIPKSFILMEGKRLDIYLLNNRRNIISYKESCRYHNGEKSYRIYITNTKNSFNNATQKWISVLEIPGSEITPKVSTQWECKIKNKKNDDDDDHDDDDDEHITFLFLIRVKGAKKVKVEIGGKGLIFTETDLSELAYDGLYQYFFDEYETIDLTCRNIGEGVSRLQYYNANGILLNELAGGNEMPLRFRQLMKVENDQSYVDCINKNDTKKYNLFTYKYRTIFTLRSSALTLFVNGVEATNMPRSINDAETFLYKFVYGETLTVTCEKKYKNIPGDISLVYDGMSRHAYIKDVIKTLWKYSCLINTKKLEGGHLQCYSPINNLKSSSIEFRARINETLSGPGQGDGQGDGQDDRQGDRPAIEVRETPVAVIVSGVLCGVLTIVTIASTFYWFMKLRKKGSAETLNEVFNRNDNPIPAFPSQWENIDNYDYTYIENEYNYIISENQVMIENSLYNGCTQDYAVPYRVSSSNIYPENHYTNTY